MTHPPVQEKSCERQTFLKTPCFKAAFERSNSCERGRLPPPAPRQPPAGAPTPPGGRGGPSIEAPREPPPTPYPPSRALPGRLRAGGGPGALERPPSHPPPTPAPTLPLDPLPPPQVPRTSPVGALSPHPSWSRAAPPPRGGKAARKGERGFGLRAAGRLPLPSRAPPRPPSQRNTCSRAPPAEHPRNQALPAPVNFLDLRRGYVSNRDPPHRLRVTNPDAPSAAHVKNSHLRVRESDAALSTGFLTSVRFAPRIALLPAAEVRPALVSGRLPGTSPLATRHRARRRGGSVFPHRPPSAPGRPVAPLASPPHPSPPACSSRRDTSSRTASTSAAPRPPRASTGSSRS